MESIQKFLEFVLFTINNVKINVKIVLIVILTFIVVNYVLNIIKKLLTRRLSKDDRIKFVSFYEYIKYFIYLIVLLVVMSSLGVKITGLIASAAALMLGVGLALQTFFQDIISGIFILIDQSLHVNDIIEIDDKVGKVTHINLRTTKAITLDNKVLVIPNHLYLSKTLYNWTQNDNVTRESVKVGVAYGSDVQLVKKLLLQAAANVKAVLPNPEPTVFFEDFGDSALQFKLVVTVEDSFLTVFTTSDLRFEIDRLFRKNHVTIPFPQRDVHIIQK